MGIWSIQRHREKRAQTTRGLLMPRARDSFYRERRVFTCDSAARGCATQMPALLPARLPPPSLNSRATTSRVQREVPGAIHRPASRRRIAAHQYVRRSDKAWGLGQFSRMCEHARTTRANVGCLPRAEESECAQMGKLT